MLLQSPGCEEEQNSDSMTSHPANIKTANRSRDEEFDEITEDEVERSMSESRVADNVNSTETEPVNTAGLVDCNNSELFERLKQSYDFVLSSGHSMGEGSVREKLASDKTHSVCVLVDKQDTPLTWKLSSSPKVRLCALVCAKWECDVANGGLSDGIFHKT